MPKTEIDLESILLKTDVFMHSIRIAIYLERGVIGLSKIYQSRILHPKKNDDMVVINEKVEFPMDHQESFLKFKIQYRQPGDSNWQSKVFFAFLADLLNLRNFLEIKFGKGSALKLNYQVRTPFPAKFADEEKFAPELKIEEQSGVIEMLTLAQNFMKRFALLRRILEDIQDFVFLKDIGRDIKLLIGFFLFLLFPSASILVLICVFLFTGVKYKLRFWLVEKFIGYCYQEGSASEIKKNLELLKKNQEKGLELLKFLKTAMYSKNRIYIYDLFSKAVLALLVGVLVLVNMPPRLLLAGGVLGLFALKYQTQLLVAFDSYRPDPTKVKAWLQRGQALAAKLKAKFKGSKERLHKCCYVYENQRWYIHTGFTNKTLVFGELKRAAELFRQEWRKVYRAERFQVGRGLDLGRRLGCAKG